MHWSTFALSRHGRSKVDLRLSLSRAHALSLSRSFYRSRALSLPRVFFDFTYNSMKQHCTASRRWHPLHSTINSNHSNKKQKPWLQLFCMSILRVAFRTPRPAVRIRGGHTKPIHRQLYACPPHTDVTHSVHCRFYFSKSLLT